MFPAFSWVLVDILMMIILMNIEFTVNEGMINGISFGGW